MANVPFQAAAPNPFHDSPPKIEFINSWNPGIGKLLIITANAPKIINGILTINESRIATKCRCAPIFDATGIKCFSINATNLSINLPSFLYCELRIQPTIQINDFFC